MMSIRGTVLILGCLFLCIYAWRDWFRSLCGLIVLTALVEHPQMPTNLLGLSGLDPWNLLLICVVLAWASQRRAQGLVFRMPRAAGTLLLIYLMLILIGFARAAFDPGVATMSLGDLVRDELFNTLKWIVPGVLLFDGCRSRSQLKWALSSIAAAYLLLAFQCARAMPIEALTDPAALEWSRLKIDKRTGLHAVDLSTVLAGGFWALIVFAAAVRRWYVRILTSGGAVFCLYAQALTGGRAGYVAWGFTGLMMAVMRWRKSLLLAPAIPLIMLVAFPAASDRMLRGLDTSRPGRQQAMDTTVVTSGRNAFWPYVFQQIGQAPMVGHGTQGTKRSGLTQFMTTRIESGAGWAHSAYLEWLVDHGAVGLAPILLFFLLMLVYAGRLFIRAPDRWLRAAGGMAFAAMLVQGVAGLTSQHFYPRIGNVFMWCSVFLMLRVHIETSRYERKRKRQATVAKWRRMMTANGLPSLPGEGVPA
jgi:O-antigen ligase